MNLRHQLLWIAVAVPACFALAASSPQCARTEDASLNPTVNPLAGGNLCVQGCIDAYQDAKKAEQARFKEAMQACNGGSECRQEEALVHERLLMELEVTKDDCLLDCEHDQGGATGGQ